MCCVFAHIHSRTKEVVPVSTRINSGIAISTFMLLVGVKFRVTCLLHMGWMVMVRLWHFYATETSYLQQTKLWRWVCIMIVSWLAHIFSQVFLINLTLLIKNTWQILFTNLGSSNCNGCANTMVQVVFTPLIEPIKIPLTSIAPHLWSFCRCCDDLMAKVRHNC